jgi:hypothetical protein
VNAFAWTVWELPPATEAEADLDVYNVAYYTPDCDSGDGPFAQHCFRAADAAAAVAVVRPSLDLPELAAVNWALVFRHGGVRVGHFVRVDDGRAWTWVDDPETRWQRLGRHIAEAVTR